MADSANTPKTPKSTVPDSGQRTLAFKVPSFANYSIRSWGSDNATAWSSTSTNPRTLFGFSTGSSLIWYSNQTNVSGTCTSTFRAPMEQVSPEHRPMLENAWEGKVSLAELLTYARGANLSENDRWAFARQLLRGLQLAGTIRNLDHCTWFSEFVLCREVSENRDRWTAFLSAVAQLSDPDANRIAVLLDGDSDDLAVQLAGARLLNRSNLVLTVPEQERFTRAFAEAEYPQKITRALLAVAQSTGIFGPVLDRMTDARYSLAERVRLLDQLRACHRFPPSALHRIWNVVRTSERALAVAARRILVDAYRGYSSTRIFRGIAYPESPLAPYLTALGEHSEGTVDAFLQRISQSGQPDSWLSGFTRDEQIVAWCDRVIPHVPPAVALPIADLALRRAGSPATGLRAALQIDHLFRSANDEIRRDELVATILRVSLQPVEELTRDASDWSGPGRLRAALVLLLAKYLPLHRIADLARENGRAPSGRLEIAEILWQRLFTEEGKPFSLELRQPFRDALARFAREGGEDWEAALSNLSVLDTAKGEDLVSLLEGDRTPRALKILACCRLSVIDARIPLASSLFPRLSCLCIRLKPDDPLLAYLRLTFQTLSTRNTSTLPSALDVVISPSHPLPGRLQLLASLLPFPSYYGATSYRLALWRLVDDAVETEDRLTVAQLLARADLLADDATADLVAVLQAARSDAENPEVLRRARSAWLEVRAFGNIIRDAESRRDLAPILDLIRDSRESALCRASAFNVLRRMNYVSTNLARVFWDLAGPDAHPAIARRAHSLLRITPVWPRQVEPIMADGPNHPLWRPLRALALFPDQNLGAKVLLRIDPFVGEPDAWRARLPLVADLPLAAQLPALTLAEPAALRTLNAAFRALRAQRTATYDLTTSLLRAFLWVTPSSRLAQTLGDIDTGGREDLSAAEARTLGDVLKYQAILSQISCGPWNLTSDPTPHVTLTQTRDALVHEIEHRVRGYLPRQSATSLQAVAALTPAIFSVTAHYSLTHRDGLPLLDEALLAASQPATWTAWRYHRPEAVKQIAFLGENDRAAWSTNLQATVSPQGVTPEVASAQRALNRLVVEILESESVPPRVRDLLVNVAASPHARLTRLEGLRVVVGKCLAGAAAPELLPALDDLPSELRDALAASRERGTRDELLAWSAALRLSVALLRLAYCSSQGLARNVLTLPEELPDSAPSGDARSAVRTLLAVRYALGRPLLRQQRAEGAPRLDPGLGERVDATIERLRNLPYVVRNELVVEERDDFRTLVEIGHNPGGQFSCQDCYSVGSLTRCLLAYVADAMTKAVVLRSREGLLARAIVRLGEPRDGGAPVLVVEPTYPRENGQDQPHTRLILDGICQMAARRGWRVAHPKSDGALLVRIPASQNTVQYDDGHAAIVEGSHSAGVCRGEYTLRVLVAE